MTKVKVKYISSPNESPAGQKYVLVVYGEKYAQTRSSLGLTITVARTVGQLSFLTAVHTAKDIAKHAGISEVFIDAAMAPGLSPTPSGMFTYVPAQDELSSNVVGLDVYNEDKQNIGTIKDIALDANGLNGYIVSVGGFSPSLMSALLHHGMPGPDTDDPNANLPRPRLLPSQFKYSKPYELSAFLANMFSDLYASEAQRALPVVGRMRNIQIDVYRWFDKSSFTLDDDGSFFWGRIPISQLEAFNGEYAEAPAEQIYVDLGTPVRASGSGSQYDNARSGDPNCIWQRSF